MKKLLTTLAAVIVVVAAGLAWFVTRTPGSPFDGAPAGSTQQAELLHQGESLARQTDCVACHSVPGKAPFAGGLQMATPMGVITTTNITPDAQTGIGGYSLADFDRAVRLGVAKDGHRLYPAMPYPSYAKLSDDDVRALYAFFQHGVQPAQQANQASTIPWPLNLRWPLALWSVAFADTTPYQPDPAKDAQWNRGAYLVQGAGHCGACHTPRGLAFNEKALGGDSKVFLAGALLDGWYAPSLRRDPNTGIGRWDEAEIVQFLKTGRNHHAVVYGSMSEAFNNSTQFMADDDLRAIAHYLVSLPGDPARDGAPWQPAAPSTAPGAPGAQIFAARCSFCHGVDGRGQSQWIPPLAGATSALAKEDASAINVTLNGSARIVAAGVPDAYRMPPFREQLSDGQVADVLTFVRTAWGNTGGAVTADAVKTLRAKTNAASSNVIVLQMR